MGKSYPQVTCRKPCWHFRTDDFQTHRLYDFQSACVRCLALAKWPWNSVVAQRKVVRYQPYKRWWWLWRPKPPGFLKFNQFNHFPPEKWWKLEDRFPLGIVTFQGRAVKLRGVTLGNLEWFPSSQEFRDLQNPPFYMLSPCKLESIHVNVSSEHTCSDLFVLMGTWTTQHVNRTCQGNAYDFYGFVCLLICIPLYTHLNGFIKHYDTLYKDVHQLLNWFCLFQHLSERFCFGDQVWGGGSHGPAYPRDLKVGWFL